MNYDETLIKFKEIERSLKDLPEIALMGAEYFPLMLSRPICVAKELLKWVTMNRLDMLVDNPHVAEEIELLQRDLGNLKKDLEMARLRGEKIEVHSRPSSDLDKWERKWKGIIP